MFSMDSFNSVILWMELWLDYLTSFIVVVQGHVSAPSGVVHKNNLFSKIPTHLPIYLVATVGEVIISVLNSTKKIIVLI